jgi:malonyl CoA-acyl carrier protein transacylase/acyl carrier protein
MITRVLDSKLPLIIYNPIGVYSKDYFTAAAESGALPVFDTEYFAAENSIEHIKELEKSGFIFGVRVNLNNDSVVDFLNTTYVNNLTTVIVTCDETADLQSSRITTNEYKLLLEVYNIGLVDVAQDFLADGVIVRGNEAPGRVSSHTSFLLLQWYIENSDLPVIVHGGVGHYTGAGMFAAGASGVVLDDQLYLVDESPLSENFKDAVRKLEEKDSILVGQSLGRLYRFHTKLSTKIIKELKEKESKLINEENCDITLFNEIKKSLTFVNDENAQVNQALFFLGPDAIFAKNFIKNSGKLKDVVFALFKRVGEVLTYVDEYDPMVVDSPLAKDHGTKYPITQGPMANISDNADFAGEVFKQGALPFLALGSLPKDVAEKMMKEGIEKAGTVGAGMIGISSLNQTIDDHMNLIKELKIPFALFAGGQPGQVNELEAAGTKAYLHTPAASILENAVKNGVKRCIFEGREAGGHVGSLTSMVLWETSIQRLVNQFSDKINSLTLIFAGGIGSKTGTIFISGMSSFLAAMGAKIGIQVSTTYLFTKEIVESGAIQPLYQKLMQEKNETIVMGETLGLSTRSLVTPFSVMKVCKEHERIKDNLPLKERKTAYEKENLGSLLIGAKAFCISFPNGKFQMDPVTEDEAHERGNYMAGDALIFKDQQTTITEVHEEFIEHKSDLYKNLNALEVITDQANEVNDEIAIVGMGAIYPESNNYDEFWKNILDKKYFIKEVPNERLDHELYYNADRKVEDKTYTKIAGVIEQFEFDHEKYGYTKEEAAEMSRTQKMILESAIQAVEDAGYLSEGKTLPKERTSVIIGTCLGNEMLHSLVLKYYYPEVKHHMRGTDGYKSLSDDEKQKLDQYLSDKMSYGTYGEKVESSALNIEAARIAKHLGLKGQTFVVDAACATSFAALDSAIKLLRSNKSDAVITGGINTNMMPEPFVGFSKMGSLSADGSYPFDKRADGFVMGEGAGVFVIKRMKDAIRDGDTIHAVIKGLGGSSDGKGKFIAAPSANGQELALTRCYSSMKSPVQPHEIEFIEAHGTSTKAGDKTEIETIKRVYKSDGKIAISSVKSQIGHLLGGAGAVGLIKAILAIKHKTFPPNGQFKDLSPSCPIEDSPLFIVENPMEWKKEDNSSRKAAVSSYGFGGINYHCVVEEFTEAYKAVPRKIFQDPTYDFNGDRLVVAGIGAIVPGARNSEELWKLIESGESKLTDLPDTRFHMEAYADDNGDYYFPKAKAGMLENYKFNNIKYRIPPSSASHIDKSQLLALDATGVLLEESGLKEKLEFGNRIGVIFGTTSGEMNSENIIRTRIPYIEKSVKDSGVAGSESIANDLGETLRKRYVTTTEDTIPGLLSNILTGRICNFYNCNGANFTIDASDASSAAAIGMASLGILNNDFEFVLTGGFDSNMGPQIFNFYNKLGVLTNGETSYFDTKAAGMNLAEGGVVMAMTKLSTAKKYNMPVIGEINSVNFSSEANDAMYSPSDVKYQNAIEGSIKDGHISKRAVRHVEVYGNANILHDQVEKGALGRVFKNRGISFGNSKSEIGYLKSAHTAFSVAKLLLMEKNKTLTANKTYSTETTIAKNGALKALTENTSLKNKRNSFVTEVYGLGGNHAAVSVSTVPDWALVDSASVSQDRPTDSLQTNVPQLITKVALLLSGQGAQRSGMMKELYASHNTAKSLIDKADAVFKSARSYSIRDLMFNDPDGKLNSTENTQPSVFISSAVVFELLKEKGLQPDLFLGHSLGEFSALYAAGALTFEDALNLVIKRSEFMKETAEAEKGSIMVLFTSAEDAAKNIKASGLSDVYVANKNSSAQTAVSGKDAAIDKFCDYLKTNGVSYKKLNLSGAFHTPLFKTAADKLAALIGSVKINAHNAAKVVSNVTATPYPADEAQIKEILNRQMVSPVEFVECVTNLEKYGIKHLVEAGPGPLLAKLVAKIDANFDTVMAMIEPRKGEADSFEKSLGSIQQLLAVPKPVSTPAPVSTAVAQSASVSAPVINVDDPGFESFLKNNDAKIKELLYEEYIKARKEEAFRYVEALGIYTGKIVIGGVSVGLPGLSSKVFSDDNFDKVLRGTNMIDKLSDEKQKRILDKNITRLFKDPNGNARYVKIESTDDIIHLAGQLGYFNLQEEYGFKYKYDTTFELAIAAGLEALKDAHIPLIMNHKVTSTGKTLPDRLMLPKDMQDTTGVIFASIFPGFETLINEITAYHYERFVRQPYKEFESLYYFIMEKIKETDVKEKVTEWFFNLKKEIKEGTYEFDRNLLIQIISLGSAHFAQFIGARGPNTQLNGACASATQGVAVAEDWIRMGRCDRVIIIGGEDATSDAQNQFVGSGFLALGAATVKKTVEEGAKPFDETRNGMIVGAGAVGMVVERADLVEKRGLKGQAEVIGTHIGNSAFHASKINVDHLAEDMAAFFNKIDKIHGLNRSDYASKMIFMSHETYTPARGGSADAEVKALKQTFGDLVGQITVANVKGYTGHTLGSGIEDAVLVKAVQMGKVPPVPNLTKIPEHFKMLKFSKGEVADYQYGFHLGAGFGSHFSFLFIKKIEENSVSNNSAYTNWLTSVTGIAAAETFIKNRILTAESVPQTVDDKANGEAKIAASAPSTLAAPAPASAAAPSAPAVNTAEVTSKIKAIIAEQTGYDSDMLETDLDLEADLGIDTVKQVEIFGKISEEYGAEVPEDLQLSDLNTIQKLAEYMASKVGGTSVSAQTSTAAAPQASASVDLGAVTSTIKSVIAEQTGYEPDMLEDDLDLEADLGIDTVKQVEIFGKISEQYGVEVPEDLQLSDLNTIHKLADYMASKAGATAAPSVTAAAVEAVSGGSSVSAAEVTAAIKNIIADQTGYEPDMLEDDLDLEADLGIDTVKQVEIFGKISENYSLEVPEDLQLADLNTIQKLAEYIGARAGSSTSAAQPAASAQTAVVESVPAVDTTEVINKIKGIIAEQTGYETDMLEDDLDLEADLGIDTVKQVEIFGKISEQYGVEVPEDLQLSDLNTIHKLAEYMAKIVSGASTQSSSSAPVETKVATVADSKETGIKRFSITYEEKPVSYNKQRDFKGKRCLVVTDTNGFAEKFVEKLKSDGAEIVTLGEEGTDVVCDFSTYDAVAKAVEEVKSKGDVNCVFNFAVVDAFYARKTNDKIINKSVKSQFILARTFAESLNKEGAVIAAVSFNSAVFSYGEGDKIIPEGAGVAGLYKSLNKELPNTLLKCVDFKTAAPKKILDSVSETLYKEITSADAEVEIGYDGDTRYGIRLKVEDPKKGDPVVNEGDRFVVTGGARGITYNILLSLVEKFKCHLVIIGRSDIAKLDSKYLDDGVTEKDVIADLKETMADAKPVEVKKAAAKILTLAETVKNIETLKSKGVAVDYHAADVTDTKRIKEIINGYDHIEGVLHAAGLEISQVLTKMDDKSFNLVFDTKVNGLLNIIDAMNGRDYKYLMTFSSVTARFGNEGQTNYTAANDMIGKMLQREAQLHPERAYKVYDWTAWEGAGMATKETVKKVLEARGLEFLPLDFGVQCFIDDLFDKDRIEVLISGMDHAFDPDNILPLPGSEGVDNFLDVEMERTDKMVHFQRTLTAERDLFIFDHVFEGTPLFLGATGMETMAEAAVQLKKDSTLIGLGDFQIPYGIKLLKGRPKELDIFAEDTGDVVETKITSVFRNPKGVVMGDPKLHYHAKYYFGESLGEKKIEIPEFVPVTVEGGFQELIYHPKRLFMDGLFRTVEELLSFEEERMITRISNSSDRFFFAGVKEPVFITDPVLVDAMFQTGGMLDVMTTEKIILPYKMNRMNLYKKPKRHAKYLCITEKTKSQGEYNTYNVTLCDETGDVYIEIIDFQMIQVSNVEEGMSIRGNIKRK